MGMTLRFPRSRHPSEDSRVSAAIWLGKLPRLRERATARTNQSYARQHPLSLIYGRIDFIVGSFREIDARDRRDACHGSE